MQADPVKTVDDEGERQDGGSGLVRRVADI